MIDRRLCIAVVSLASLLSLHHLRAEEKSAAGRNEFYTGYGLLSGSFNQSGSSWSPLNGWDTALTMKFKDSGSLSLTLGALGIYGTNSGALQVEHSVLVGPQWSRHGAKVSPFIHGLVGLGFINNGAFLADHAGPSSNVVFAALAGGGVDTALSHRMAWRVEGDYLRSQYNSSSDQIHNIDGNFAHFTTGLVIHF